jgi:hypothetical protein
MLENARQDRRDAVDECGGRHQVRHPWPRLRSLVAAGLPNVITLDGDLTGLAAKVSLSVAEPGRSSVPAAKRFRGNI